MKSAVTGAPCKLCQQEILLYAFLAHRLATVLQADLIHVVSGWVVEWGTHHEPLMAKGAYARLFQLQFQGEDEQPLAV